MLNILVLKLLLLYIYLAHNSDNGVAKIPVVNNSCNNNRNAKYTGSKVASALHLAHNLDNGVAKIDNKDISLFNKFQIFSDSDPDAQDIHFDHETYPACMEEQVDSTIVGVGDFVLVGHGFEPKLTQFRGTTLIVMIWMNRLHILSRKRICLLGKSKLVILLLA